MPASHQERDLAMPELPEVETVVRYLQPLLLGRRVVSVRAARQRLRSPIPRNALRLLIGQTFTAVRRRGKWIVLTLQQHCLLVHLGMTGRLQVLHADTPLARHCHLVCWLAPEPRQLRYTDARRFGAIHVLPPAEAERFLERQLGPEPFCLSAVALHHRLQATARPLKVALLDQRLLAGLGNIYADESLYQAGLFPKRAANTLSLCEAGRLVNAIRTVLHRAIACQGSSIRDYLFGENGRGSYQEEFLVYGRDQQPCRRCSQPIQRCRLAGRSTYFCPRCQPQKPTTR